MEQGRGDPRRLGTVAVLAAGTVAGAVGTFLLLRQQAAESLAPGPSAAVGSPQASVVKPEPPPSPAAPPPAPAPAPGSLLLLNGRAGTIVVAVRPGAPPRDFFFAADGSLGPLPFEPGEYEITLSRPGFATERRPVVVRPGETREVNATLAEKDGALTLDSDPPGAAVEVDDALLGTAPLAAVPLAPGVHSLRLTHEDADDLARELTVRGEAVCDLGVLRLPPLAVLDLSRLPAGVRATVDGSPVEGKQRRRPGPVVVRLSREGSFDQEVTVVLKPGAEGAPVPAEWSSVPGVLDLSKVPPDVTVFVDGRETARGPDGRVSLPPGKVHLGLDGEGLGTVTGAAVVLEPGKTIEVPTPEWKAGELRPAVGGLSSAPRRDHRGAALPPGLVEEGGRILSTRDGAEMVLVPAGAFTMGTDGGDESERPARKVSLSAFLMDRHEVTNAQFAEFVAATGFVTKAERVGWSNDADRGGTAGYDWRHPDGPSSSVEGREREPVILVSWDDARAYAAWAGRRLPTEAEFERALRGGTDGRKFPWGDDLLPRSRVANLLDEAAHAAWTSRKGWIKGYRDGFEGRAPVGSFQANPFGLFDVAGNVSEWCGDGFEKEYYTRAPQADPPGPDPGKCRYRVHRGGSWMTEEKNLHCGNRGYQLPGARWTFLGFRCAASLPPAGDR